MNGRNFDFIIPHGFTQTGKSSVINTMTNGEAKKSGVEEGDGTGESKTGADGKIP
jgi:GTP-binding protein EngB required for normal cell division